jgi:hypothetical protein
MYKVKYSRCIGTQIGSSTAFLKSQGTQCNKTEKISSYGRQDKTSRKLTYDELKEKYLTDKATLFEWLQNYGLLAKNVCCPNC